MYPKWGRLSRIIIPSIIRYYKRITALELIDAGLRSCDKYSRFGPAAGYGLKHMSKSEVDDYLASLEEPKRSTLQALRRVILEIIPSADQCISYGLPAFRLQGKVIAGFAAFKNHLSYLPHSGSVFPEVGDAVSKYKTSAGALQFPIDKPLPKTLVKKLIAIRKRQALGGKT